MVAAQLGRNGIGIELNSKYAEMAHERIVGDAPLLNSVEVVH
jgi:DNA modification methylase